MRQTIAAVLCAALFCAALAAPNAGFAYTLNLVEHEETIEHLRWTEDRLPVQFRLNDQTGPQLENVLDGSDPVGAVQRALGKWFAASGVRVALSASALTDGVKDGVSLVTFADTETNREMFEMSGAVAFTLVCYEGAEITEADVLFNPALRFSTTLDTDEALIAADAFDIEGVATHELGHAIGLHHTGVESAAMWSIATVGARQLDADDVAGARTLYPLEGPNLSLRGLVTNPAPIFGAQVVAIAADGRTYSTLTTPDGHYAIEHLPAGPYTMYVEPLDGPHSAVAIDPCVRFGNLRGAGIFDKQTFDLSFRTSFLGGSNTMTAVQPTVDGGAPTPNFTSLVPDTAERMNPTLIGAAIVNDNGYSYGVDEVAVEMEPGSERWIAIAGEHLDLADTITVLGGGVEIDASEQLVDVVADCPEGPLAAIIVRVIVDEDAVPGARSLLFRSEDDVAAFTGALRVRGMQPSPPPSPTPTPTAPTASTPSPSPTTTTNLPLTATPTRPVIPTYTPGAPTVCTGDCNGNHIVEVNELVQGVRILLGRLSLATCPGLDGNDDDRPTIDEVVQAVAAAGSGCVQ